MNAFFFLTGLDEHGQKVQQAAMAKGKAPQEYCDELALAWKGLATTLNLSHDDFHSHDGASPQVGRPGGALEASRAR